MSLIDPLSTFGLITEQSAVEAAMLRSSNHELQDDLSHVLHEVRELQESMLEISERFDNVNWEPLGNDAGAETELKLQTVKKVAQLSRAVLMINPFVKSGVEARISYVWGKGVAFDGVEDCGKEMEINRARMFSAQSFQELERALAADGNVFTALPIEKDKRRAYRIPLDEISGAVTHKTDAETIILYRREWTEYTTNGRTGNQQERKRIEYLPSIDYYYERLDQKKPMHKTWRGEKVNQDYVVHHMAVNKQVGWKWGLPDILPVIFWSKAYKEYLEDNALLVKAYARLAWQVKAGSAQGAAAAASAVRRAPTRDPLTGDLRDIAGTSVTGMGHEITALPPTGSQVDFEKGSSVAAAIAAGLEVWKVVITRDPGAGNRSSAESLDGPTRKAMETRQQLHVERFLEIYQFWGLKVSELGEARPQLRDTTEQATNAGKNSGSGRDYVTVTFPPIESDATKDRVAALGTAVELGILYKEEARKEALDVLGIAPYKAWDELPEPPEKPAVSGAFGNTEPSVIAKQGESGGVAAKDGAMTGDNDARDNRDKDSGK